MKVLLLCLMATLAISQDMDMSGDGDVMVMDANRTAELLAIQANYDTAQASTARLNHLFCLNRTTNEATGAVTFTEFEQRGANVWTLFLQIPLISYLDPQRKLSLMDTIMDVLDNSYTYNDICIGTYETYELSYFRESVLVHVYSRDVNNPINAQTWSDRFNSQVNNVLNDGNDLRVIRYPGQSGVIALNFSGSTFFTNLIQPRLQTNEGVDLTSLAVFIGSYGYNYTFADDTVDSVSRNIDGQRRNSFADNTNPINYGLEPGDYVFAVFGAILTALVLGLIILGYFIHPFFLA